MVGIDPPLALAARLVRQRNPSRSSICANVRTTVFAVAVFQILLPPVNDGTTHTVQVVLGD
jgi:hypothetical protein